MSSKIKPVDHLKKLSFSPNLCEDEAELFAESILEDWGVVNFEYALPQDNDFELFLLEEV